MARKKKFAVGLDFGTDSQRAVLVEVATGELAAVAAAPYRHGVIDEFLPVPGKVRLPPDWALQDPEDYLRAAQATVPALLKAAKVSGKDVIGLGIDFTACTVLPVLADGTPLSSLPDFRRRPHAWTKLWKHHAAEPQAKRIEAAAKRRNEPWLRRYGRKVSSEWLLPKLLQVLEEDAAVLRRSARFMEAQDWLVWRWTGREMRSACAAGYKGLWSKRWGPPGQEFLRALAPGLPRIARSQLGSEYYAPGTPAGGLSPAWAARLGLPAGTPVGVPIIDAHSAVLGCGVSRTREMVLCMGTSSCHLLLDRRGKCVDGICGVVEDGILPGFFAYEAGQAAVGDIFGWYVRHGLPGGGGDALHRQLEEEAAALSPGESGLLALDWWNGNRSILVDAGLSGLILGFSLSTRPHDVYRALLESTAFGTLRIIQEFERNGIPVRRIHAAGGLPGRNPLLMQIYADVSGRRLDAIDFPHTCALGAAVLGALAARPDEPVAERIEAMAQAVVRRSYRPDARNHRVYGELYGIYCRLHDDFGRGGKRVMQALKGLRARQRISKE